MSGRSPIGMSGAIMPVSKRKCRKRLCYQCAGNFSSALGSGQSNCTSNQERSRRITWAP